MYLRIILTYRQRHLLKQGCLTCFRRRYDHTSLPLSDGRQQVDDPHGRTRLSALHPQTFVGENRRHIFKIRSSHSLHRVYGINLRQI